jgi:hypothetical protein
MMALSIFCNPPCELGSSLGNVHEARLRGVALLKAKSQAIPTANYFTEFRAMQFVAQRASFETSPCPAAIKGLRVS